MMEWKQERVLVFIWAGQFLNDRSDEKFYFDKDDQTFFKLYVQNNEYRMFDKTPSNLTVELEQNLQAKIVKVRTSSTSIIEIKRVDKQFNYLTSIPAKGKEEFKLKIEIEKEMAQLAFQFLKDNKIDLETAEVIELY